MGALLNDSAVIEDEDQIGIHDGGKTVGDNKAGAVLHQLVHCLLNQDFRECVHIGGCFIENQERFICQQRTGNRQ